MKHILLLLLAGLLPFWGYAQSGYIKDRDTLALSEEDAIFEKLDTLSYDFKFARSYASIYDTLIQNVYGFRANEAPVYADHVLQQRLAEIPTVIPMDFNEHVRKYINMYTLNRREQVSRMMGLSRVYFPIFETALDRHNMPMELKYLPVVESALNPLARSRVGATGLWQFMLATGKYYGLDVNTFVDERRNPYKSTDAAMAYLKNAYNEFGDWLLAIASYNCGPGNVRRALQRAGGSGNFWTVREYLPAETRGYVPAFIAACYVFNHTQEHNLYPINYEFDYDADTLHIRRLDISMAELAELTRTKVESLRQLNPELIRDRIPYTSRTYVMRVPEKVATYFAANEYSIRQRYGAKTGLSAQNMAMSAAMPVSGRESDPYRAPGASSGKLRIHTVKTGEVVGEIAKMYNVPASSIASWNGLRNYKIYAGQPLKIYAAQAPAHTATAEKPVTGTHPSQHTVRHGDSLWEISKRYGMEVRALETLNPSLNARDLKVGQIIRLR